METYASICIGDEGKVLLNIYLVFIFYIKYKIIF